MKFLGEIFNNWANELFGINVYKTLESTTLQWPNNTSVSYKWGTF